MIDTWISPSFSGCFWMRISTFNTMRRRRRRSTEADWKGTWPCRTADRRPCVPGAASVWMCAIQHLSCEYALRACPHPRAPPLRSRWISGEHEWRRTFVSRPAAAGNTHRPHGCHGPGFSASCATWRLLHATVYIIMDLRHTAVSLSHHLFESPKPKPTLNPQKALKYSVDGS